MKQAIFIAQHQQQWSEFEFWLDGQKKTKKTSKKNSAKYRRRQSTRLFEPLQPIAQVDPLQIPANYRQICQHLALARDRHYSPDLVERLNRLVVRGHHSLYGTRSEVNTFNMRFLSAGFAQLVRSQWRLVLLSAACFYGPFLLSLILLQFFPDMAYYIMGSEQLKSAEQMYDPSSRQIEWRDPSSNITMFGFYIWNNVRIGFQTFATGLFFGIGSLFYLLFNGLFIGTIAGHLTHIGYNSTFWNFVSGHSALELNAIVVSGAAGLRLGSALISPGTLSRKAALVGHAQIAVKLMYGAAIMFIMAAFIEGFWSPQTAIPPLIKYIFGITWWVMIAAYFILAGRRRAYAA